MKTRRGALCASATNWDLSVCSHSLCATFCPLFQKWLSTSSGAVQGRIGVALGSAFLLLDFLCAYTVKEKRLKTFAIKGLLTLFLLRIEPQKKKLCKKKTGVMRSRRKPPKLISFTSGNPYAARATAFEKAVQNFFGAWFVRT